MDLLTTTKGTLFTYRYSQSETHTFVATSDPYPCHHQSIMKIKAHNITTGADHEFGSVGLIGAKRITQEK